MITAIGTIFTIYVLLQLLDDFAFHRRRNSKQHLSRREKLGRPFDSVVLAVCTGMVIFFEFEAPFSSLFMGLALLSVTFLHRDAFGASQHWSGGEIYLHHWMSTWHVLTVLTLLVAWPFAHGVSIFTGMVLPFSTSGILPTLTGFLIALVVLAILQTLILGRVSLGSKAEKSLVQSVGEVIEESAVHEAKVEDRSQDSKS